jgi:hypothetical protein
MQENVHACFEKDKKTNKKNRRAAHHDRHSAGDNGQVKQNNRLMLFLE